MLLALLIVPAAVVAATPVRGVRAIGDGVGWKAAYFRRRWDCRLVLWAVGMLATFFVERGAARKRLLQIAILPVVVVGVAFVIRCVKAGHLPIWVNAVIPISACLVGAALGLGLFYRRWKLTLGVAVAVIALAAWGLLGSASAPLRQATTDCLHRLVEAGPFCRRATRVSVRSCRQRSPPPPAEQIQCCRIARPFLRWVSLSGTNGWRVRWDWNGTTRWCANGGAAVGHDLAHAGRLVPGITV